MGSKRTIVIGLGRDGRMRIGLVIETGLGFGMVVTEIEDEMALGFGIMVKKTEDEIEVAVAVKAEAERAIEDGGCCPCWYWGRTLFGCVS